MCYILTRKTLIISTINYQMLDHISQFFFFFRNKLLEKDGVLLIHDWERKHYKQLLQKGSEIDN